MCSVPRRTSLGTPRAMWSHGDVHRVCRESATRHPSYLCCLQAAHREDSEGSTTTVTKDLVPTLSTTTVTKDLVPTLTPTNPGI